MRTREELLELIRSDRINESMLDHWKDNSLI